MGVNEDKFDMPKSRFEEQRELTDEEMQAYKDMLRKKEKREVINVFNVNPPKGIEIPLKGDATTFYKNSKNNSVGIEENDMEVMIWEEAFKELLDYIGVYDLGVQRWVDEENGLWYDRKEQDHITITEVLYRAKDAIEW